MLNQHLLKRKLYDQIELNVTVVYYNILLRTMSIVNKLQFYFIQVFTIFRLNNFHAMDIYFDKKK